MNVALKVLDGAPDAGLVRVASQTATNPDIAKLTAASLEHERRIEQQQNDWLSRNRR